MEEIFNGFFLDIIFQPNICYEQLIVMINEK